MGHNLGRVTKHEGLDFRGSLKDSGNAKGRTLQFFVNSAVFQCQPVLQYRWNLGDGDMSLCRADVHVGNAITLIFWSSGYVVMVATTFCSDVIRDTCG
jgi:hypothetical protein